MHRPHYDYDAFISYSKEDSEAAQKVAARLERLCAGEHKPNIFLDKQCIGPGDNFVDKINDGLSSARFYLLLLSPASIQAEWPTAERDAALLGDPSGRGGRVVPILVKDCEIPPLLAIRHWIDMRDKSGFDVAMAGLASKIAGKAPPHATTDNNASTALENRAMAGAPARTHSHEPDMVDEELYTNMYRVKEVPTIRSATTEFATRQSIRQELGRTLPALVVSGGRLYTSSDIRNADNPLGPAIDPGTIKDVPPESWLEDDDRKRTLTALLNLHASHRCADMGLSYDKTGKKYYGDKARITSEKIHWLSHVQKGSRALILPYPSTGEARFYRHRAIRLSFRILGSDIFLQIRPSWTFTEDGSTVIQDQKKRSALNTRLRSYGGNDGEFTEQRFWAWLLSKGGRIEMGDPSNSVKIERVPLKFSSQAGIYGDHLPVSFDKSDPPQITIGDYERSTGRRDYSK